MQLGFFLKQYRSHTGLSGKRLATLLGISKYALEKYENAGVMPGYEAGQKILHFFQLKDLNDISDSEFSRSLHASTAEDGPPPNMDPTKVLPVLHYEKMLIEKEKRIVYLEEIVRLLREQVILLKRTKT